MEYLGPIFGALVVMVSTICKDLKNRLDLFIQNLKIMETCRDMAITIFGFRSTFNEGSVRTDSLFYIIWALWALFPKVLLWYEALLL